MTAIQEPTVGRFSVDVVLTNQEDLVRAKDRRIDPSQVRRVTVRGVVDSGATRLVIPAAIAEKLGLEISGTVKVRYADGRTAERPVARLIHLAYAGRAGTFTAVVEPDRESALIGAIVMEDLDLIVDCTTQRLIPRDPDHIISEIE
jgi:predicted aspartyl protease